MKRPITDQDTCGKCGGIIVRDIHPDGQAVGRWQCTECDWYQEELVGSESEDLPF